jgi:hypothetical protein
MALEDTGDRLANAGALLAAAERSPSVAPARAIGVRVPRAVPPPTAIESALPEDPELPGLVAIRASGLRHVLPKLDLGAGPIELEVRAYKQARRITLELRAPGRRLAVKAYQKSPEDEVALAETFAAAGLAAGSGARVPRVVAWKRELRLLVIEWLEGPTVSDLLRLGQGERAAELAAGWLELAAKLPVDLGPPRDAAWMLRRSSEVGRPAAPGPSGRGSVGHRFRRAPEARAAAERDAGPRARHVPRPQRDRLRRRAGSDRLGVRGHGPARAGRGRVHGLPLGARAERGTRRGRRAGEGCVSRAGCAPDGCESDGMARGGNADVSGRAYVETAWFGRGGP